MDTTVGAVVSVTHVSDADPLPATPFGSWMPLTLTVSAYVPSAAVKPPRPLTRYVLAETRLVVTALVSVTGLPLRVRAKSAKVNVVKLIGREKTMSTLETGVLRGSGVTGVIVAVSARA